MRADERLDLIPPSDRPEPGNITQLYRWIGPAEPDLTPQITYVLDRDLKYRAVYVHDARVHPLYPAESFINMRLPDVMGAALTRLVVAAIEQGACSGEAQEIRYLFPHDGRMVQTRARLRLEPETRLILVEVVRLLCALIAAAM